MWKRTLLLLAFLAACPVFAREASESWVEVRTPHFTVLSQSGEKQARHLAGQLERMQSVFHATFPSFNMVPGTPVLVLAVRDRNSFQAMKQPASPSRGNIEPAGLFLSSQDKNYVLLRLDAQGAHPYAPVYREYARLLMSDSGASLPLWVKEGVAEFFQNVEIHDKEVSLGQPGAEDLLSLRQNRLLPLETLFAVDEKSPYSHDERKASLFRAECWALVDFLQTADQTLHSHLLMDYIDVVSRHVDPVVAGDRVFSDLRQLQKSLEAYAAHTSFTPLQGRAPAEWNEAAFPVTGLPTLAVSVMRADFLARNERGKEAQALLEIVLHDDPKNAAAHETMGFLEFREGHMEEARKYYQEAMRLDSRSYLACYYVALTSLRLGDSTSPEQIEANLLAALKLNPKFAPAYDQLAILYGKHREKLEAAQRLSLQAVQLDPSNLGFRIDAATLLQKSGHSRDASTLLRNSVRLARTADEAASIESRIKSLDDDEAAHRGSSAAGTAAVAGTRIAPLAGPKHPTEEQRGPKLLAKGIIHGVQCSDPATLEINIQASGKKISLYSNNYFQISFTTANYLPEGEIHPCTDLEGAKVSVQYTPTSDKSVDGQMIAIELSR